MTRCFYLMLILINTVCSCELYSESYQEHVNQNYSLVLNTTTDSGFGAVVAGMVLGALNLYDQGQFAGISIDFEGGLFSDPLFEDANWWKYYFEPINLGENSLPKYKTSVEDALDIAHQGLSLSRHAAFNLIQKYIQIKPHILEEVDLFEKNNFQNFFVIGIHHRGTDKINEHPLVSYKKNLDAFKKTVKNLSKSQRKKMRVYIATDDQGFLDFFKSSCKIEILYNDFERSSDGTPLHYGNKFYSSNYQKGKDALVDCILLSKCNVLIKPQHSCLSRLSIFFNPNMSVIELAGG